VSKSDDYKKFLVVENFRFLLDRFYAPTDVTVMVLITRSLSSGCASPIDRRIVVIPRLCLFGLMNNCRDMLEAEL